MKQIFILWISAIIITFLSSYFRIVTSSNYPVSGITSINGHKINYMFDKINYGKDKKEVKIKVDDKKLKGWVIFKKAGENNRDTIQLNYLNNFLIGYFNNYNPGTKIFYTVQIFSEGQKIIIPANGFLSLTYSGKIPDSILSVFYLTLIGGILLSVRTGLEFFNENIRTKKLTLFTLISFGLYGIVVAPVVQTFKTGMIDSKILSPSEMYSINDLSYFLVWLIITLIIFNYPKFKWINLAGSIGVLLLYLFI